MVREIAVENLPATEQVEAAAVTGSGTGTYPEAVGETGTRLAEVPAGTADRVLAPAAVAALPAWDLEEAEEVEPAAEAVGADKKPGLAKEIRGA
jgi:hypothetical protein